MTIGCGISHKNTKHSDEYNKTCRQISIQNFIRTLPIIEVSHKYTSVMLNPYTYNR
jgi:hypothetical protein